MQNDAYSCPFASSTNVLLALLKVVALYFDRLVILDLVGVAGRPAGHGMQEAVKLLKEAGIPQAPSARFP